MSELHLEARKALWGGALIVLLFIALLVSLGAATPVLDSAPRSQAVLLQLARQEPETTLAVIVQKWARDGSLEALVARLGGVVTKDLPIINAFAAQLPAHAVPALARAQGVRWVSLDAPVVKSVCVQCIDTSRLLNAYIWAIGADRLWNEAPYLQGQGVTVAIVDSGVNSHDDLKNPDGSLRIATSVHFNSFTNNARDKYGHGTHVAGTIGGNGSLSAGAYIGVAPKVTIVNVKVSDEKGRGRTSDVVAGLQWVYNNRTAYNIRVVNLSMNSSVPESYHTSPLDAALEILWFNRIVVVVSAGNNGTNGILYPPANDPFVITVGATDDRGTADINDDLLASFSAYGTTQSGCAKPDIVAPGRNIISLNAGTSTTLYKAYPDHRVSVPGLGPDHYFRMSGTSMASAVAAGAAALLLQDEPRLTPDQVKFRLMATARPFNDGVGVGAGYLDIYAAVRRATRGSANIGTPASQLLWSGTTPITWGSVNWDSVNWDSVNWESVNWDSVNWDSVNWDSVNWDE